ncbi:MAG: ABC transporter permease [Proteobacteria bacterium]|nr:ABC transporter permease [Pseudomonadota bacterium]
MRSRIPAIARKETLHVLRDWRTLYLAFILPVMMILLFGYAITFDIKDFRLAVLDQDHSNASRNLVRRFTANGYFRLVAEPNSADEISRLLDSGEAQVALAIPAGFARNIERQEGEKIQVLVDGSESNTATIGTGYIESIFAGWNISLIKEALARRGIKPRGIPPIDPRVRVWFNPEMKSANTIVPGLIAVIMMMVAALLTSLTVVRERELGSLEGLIATPVRKHEILVGKMLPYLVIALIDCAVIAGIGVVVFNVPFAGSVVIFIGTALVFAAAGLSIGLLASVVAKTQLFANQIVVLSTMLPSMLLSGFMFPIESMPKWVQAITYIVPARYFIKITRGIMLKNQPAADLVVPTLFLLALGTLLFTISVNRFQKKL